MKSAPNDLTGSGYDGRCFNEEEPIGGDVAFAKRLPRPHPNEEVLRPVGYRNQDRVKPTIGIAPSEYGPRCRGLSIEANGAGREINDDM